MGGRAFSLLLIAAAVFGASVPARAYSTTVPRDALVVLRALNAERAMSRVRPLALDRALSSVAQAHASDMARRGFFSHVTPEGIDPFARMRRGHCMFRFAGENIGLAGDSKRAHAVIWNDPAHRRLVLERHFARVGIGVARARLGTILVEDFSD
jgi:uncharacterized protein YkwD